MKNFSYILVLFSFLLFVNSKDCVQYDGSGNEIQAKDHADCIGRTATLDGYTCCFLSGEWDLKKGVTQKYCGEIKKDDLKNNLAEIINKIKAGCYFSEDGSVDPYEVMVSLDDLYCTQNYITRGLLTLFTLITLLI